MSEICQKHFFVTLEAPPGFEPGMEVLQTSALPLGDGAGRNRIVRGIRPRQMMRRQQRGKKEVFIDLSTTRKLRIQAVRPRRFVRPSCAPEARSARSGVGIGTHGAERAGAAKGRDVLKIGAGNGIRTRDFDLGKVALYH